MLLVGEVVAMNRRRQAFFYDLNGALYSGRTYKARAKNLIALPDLAKGGNEDIGVAETFDQNHALGSIRRTAVGLLQRPHMLLLRR